MKRIMALLCIAILICNLFTCTIFAMEAETCILYVATDGNDAGDGSKEKPLQTLIAARNKIRELKKNGNSSKGYTVYVRGGDYYMTESLVLTEEDSGMENAYVTYCAYPGEKVTLVGGQMISGTSFSKVPADAEILNRIVDTEARKHLYMLDLTAVGIEDVGKTYWKGAYSYSQKLLEAGVITEKPNVPGVEILFNGEDMTLARYPNEGYMSVDSVIVPGYNQSDTSDTAASIHTPFTIGVTDEQVTYWANAATEGALLYGFWRYDWADQTIPVGSVDVANKTITGAVPSLWSTMKNRPFYIYNLIEELDAPGEYYIDHQTDKNILYLYPTADIGNAKITITLLDKPIVHMNNTSYIRFKNIDILGSRSNGYLIQEGHHNEVADCEISYTAQQAVAIRYNGSYNGVRDSYIHDVEGGVTLMGGTLSSLTPGYNYVENCEIERFSRLNATYTSAIGVGGVGNIIRYNKLHDGPHTAIEFGGNNNQIVYNEIYDVVKSTDDAGAVYGGLNWDGRGNEISYNYFHDIKASGATATQGSGVGAIFLDGGQCETYMIGNVFENIAGKAIWIAGGRDNVAQSNIMVNCTDGLLLTDIMYKMDFSAHHYPRLTASPYINSPVWKRTFGRLQNMLKLTDDEKRLPVGNVFCNNLAYQTNLYRETTNYSGAVVPVTRYLDVARNIETDSDPGFVDAANKNYQLTDNASIFAELPNFHQKSFDSMQSLTDKQEQYLSEAVIMKFDSPIGFSGGEKQLLSENNIEVVPYVKSGVTYVPAIFAAKALGMSVTEENGVVTIIGNDITLTLSVNGKAYQKNGVSGDLSYATVTTNNVLMIAVTDLADLLSQEMYVSDNGIVSIGEGSALLSQEENKDLMSYLLSTLSIS